MNALLLAWSQVRPQLGQLLIAVATIALGVALAASMLLSNASLRRGFEESVDILAGGADLQVTSLGGGVIEERLVEAVRGVPGVDVAAALLVGTAYLEGSEPLAVRLIGVDMLDESATRLYRAGDPLAAMADGLLFLNRPDSVLFTRSLARRRGLEVGEVVPVELPPGRGTWTLRGLLDDGVVGRAFGGRLAVMDLFGAQQALGAPGGASQIDVKLDPGADPSVVGARLREVMPDHLAVAFVEDRRAKVRDSLAAFQVVLDLIGGMALLLAVMVTGNRLSTLYQERLWEMGVMRALGISRLKLVRDLLAEAFLVSLLAVAIGLPLGIGFAQVIVAPVADSTSLNFKEAIAASWVAPRTLPLAVAGAAGILSALLAAIVPAIVAVRRSVVSVLAKGRRRDVVDEALVKRTARWVVLIAALGVWSMRPFLPNAVVAGLGMLLIAVAGALLLTPLLRIVAEPVGRLFGVAAQIGVEDQSRLPSRALGAAGVLMAGIAIPVWLAGVADSFEDYVVEAVMKVRRGDLVVESHFELGARGAGRPVFSDDVIDVIAGTAGVDAVGAAVIHKAVEPEMGILALDPVRLRRAEFGDWGLEPGAAPGALERVARGEAILVDTNLQENYDARVGKSLELVTPSGTVAMPVAGVLRTIPIIPKGDVILSREVYRRLWKDDTVTRAFVLVSPGYSVDAVREAVGSRLGDRHNLDVKTVGELSEWFGSAVWSAFRFVRVFTGLILVVVLFGCGDALSANVLERTRELGALRALGMSRGQIRRMILAQALAIGVTGSGLAIVVGLAMGFAFTEGLVPALLGWELAFHPSLGVALLGAVLGTLACILGAAIPAERAARFSPALALRYD